MGDALLYAVDSNGETTPSGPTGSDGTDKASRSRSKARPKYPVPTDRMKFPDTQVASLIAACVASRGGEEGVTAEAQANFMDVGTATAGLNNAWFVNLGLLVKVGKGTYKPTDLALQFQQKWSFDQATAPAVLRPAFQKSWFYDLVVQRLQVGKATVKQMVEALASYAGTDASYATQYTLLLNWLELVGLITTTDGTVVLTTAAPVTAPESIQNDVEDIDTGQEDDVDRELIPRSTAHRAAVDRPTPVIRLTFDLTLSQDDLARLTPEQIATLFDGAGKLASVKAAIAEG